MDQYLNAGINVHLVCLPLKKHFNILGNREFHTPVIQWVDVTL